MRLPTPLQKQRRPPVGCVPSWHPGNGGTFHSFPGYACDVCPCEWMWQCTFSGILESGRKPLTETHLNPQRYLSWLIPVVLWEG